MHTPWVSGIIQYGGTWERVEQGVFRINYEFQAWRLVHSKPQLQCGQATAMLKASPQRMLFEGKTFVPVRVDVRSQKS